MVQLDVVHRQGQQSTFLDVLMEVRDGNMTGSVCAELVARGLDKLSPEEQRQFDGALRLCATKPNAQVHNDKGLAAIHEGGAAIALSKAEHSQGSSMQQSSEACAGLAGVVQLGVGAQVMLTQNLWPTRGLMNGSIGRVVDIIYLNGRKPPQVPDFVIVHFPQSCLPGGHALVAGWVGRVATQRKA